MLSGLVPLALIVGAAACYGRACPGFGAVLALVFGFLGVLAGTAAVSARGGGCRLPLGSPEPRAPLSRHHTTRLRDVYRLRCRVE